MEKPVFIGSRFASRALGCWHGCVESRLGKPDALLRFGSRDQKAWVEKRIDNIIPRTETPIILYGRAEARRFVGISWRSSFRILPDEICVGWFPGFGKMNPLFLESQLSEIRRAIASGIIKLQTRSLRGPKHGIHFADARHVCAEAGIESQRINRLRELPKWLAMNV